MALIEGVWLRAGGGHGERGRGSRIWSLVSLIVALLPQRVVMLGATPEGRGFLVEFDVGLGLVGFAMLGMQFITTGRFQWVASYFG